MQGADVQSAVQFHSGAKQDIARLPHTDEGGATRDRQHAIGPFNKSSRVIDTGEPLMMVRGGPSRNETAFSAKSGNLTRARGANDDLPESLALHWSAM